MENTQNMSQPYIHRNLWLPMNSSVPEDWWQIEIRYPFSECEMTMYAVVGNGDYIDVKRGVKQDDFANVIVMCRVFSSSYEMMRSYVMPKALSMIRTLTLEALLDTKDDEVMFVMTDSVKRIFV
jgi:hypothetical protein